MCGTTRHDPKRINCPLPPGRRGLAMLLVLISLASATILSMAYLSSRDNSAAIGKNVADAAAARWGAASGMDLAVAVLETDTSWRTLHVNGRLINGYAVAGAVVDVDLIDLERNRPPNADSRFIRIIVTATVNGVQQTAYANAEVMPYAGQRVAVDLSEFAIFASRKIYLTNQSTLTRWPTAPLKDLGQRLAVGSQAVATMSVEVRNQAEMVDTTIFHSDDASGTHTVSEGEIPPAQTALPDTIPMPNPPSPPATAPEVAGIDTTSISTRQTLTGVNRFDRLELSTANGVITLADGATLIVDDRMEIRSNAGIVVNGKATIVVFGEYRMQKDSYVELKPDAALTMFIRNNVNLSDAYMGDERAVKVRDVSGNAPYMETTRLRIWGVPQEGVNPTWTLTNQTAIKASIYSPTANITVTQNSAVHGRIAGFTVNLFNNATLFYDPSLDTGNGYNNPQSPLFDADGNLKGEVVNLASLSTSDLSNLAASLGLQVNLGDSLIGAVLDSADETPVNQPTPRTMPCAVNLLVWGSDVTMVEAAARP